MCGVIVVDAGRSRSTFHGCDAYIHYHFLGYRHDSLQKKDKSVTFCSELIFFCHAYDTSMMIIVTKPGIIIDVVGSYFYDKKT